MLAAALALLAGDSPRFGSNPAAATGVAGACTGSVVTTDATIALSWAVANPSDGVWQAKIYKDGVLQATQTSSSTTFTYTVTGYKEGTGSNQISPTFTFRVDIVDKITGAVLATQAVAWAKTYSQCPQPVVSGVTVATVGAGTSTGTCSGSTQTAPATVQLSWSLTNGDATNTVIRVFRNGTQVGGDLGGTVTSLSSISVLKNRLGSVNCANSTFNWDVRVVRTSDNATLSSATASHTESLCDCPAL